jgi:hypothetical protein
LKNRTDIPARALYFFSNNEAEMFMALFNNFNIGFDIAQILNQEKERDALAYMKLSCTSLHKKLAEEWD